MSGTANPYTIGRNASIVLLWSGVRIDMRDVIMFTASQETKQQRSDPLNSLPVEFNTPSGWRGSFAVDRANHVLDDLFAQIEAAFWNSGVIGSGTLYAYIQETDGSTSTYEYIQVALRLSQAGSYSAENIVRQTVEFFASQRNRI